MIGKRNRTVTISADEMEQFKKNITVLTSKKTISEVENKIINQDILNAALYLPANSVDLLFLDPPYNLTKNYNSNTFRSRSYDEYQQLFENWLQVLIPLLKDTASIYICCEWSISHIIFAVANKYFNIQNRIVWQREKGRGAKHNWKNNCEDIWFATMTKNYYFNVEAVKIKKKVMAPYRNANGKPKDWHEDTEGSKYRMTYPSNIWTDLTVPFWSMPENTPHPTQKPEKMLAKIILASSRPGDVILDPFLGSGTTAVVAKKLNRRFIGVELDTEYCGFALKRLENIKHQPHIQGFNDGVFWERNTHNIQKKKK